jgi:YggT family protein
MFSRLFSAFSDTLRGSVWLFRVAPGTSKGPPARMDTVIIPLLQVINVALDLYKWVVVIWVVLGWLVAFNVVNSRNQFVGTIGRALDGVVEPALRRIRRYIPTSFGNMDISAVVLFLLILFVQLIIGRLIINIAS